MSERDVLIAIAPEVDATALAAWVLAQDGVAEVIVTPLSDIGDDPALGFRDGRAVIGLRSGDLLLPSTLAGAEVLLQRPEGSYAIVLTAAERIRTEADVAAVQRAVDGALLGRPSGSLSWLDDPGDASGRSQPPARGWLLFSQQEVVPLLAGQVARDAEALSRWLAAAPEGQRELAGRRARHQQDVAAEARGVETAQRDSDQARLARRHARVLPGVRDSVTRLRKLILGHLDAQAGSLRRELVASLSTLRADLIAQAANARDADALTALVRDRESRWREDASRQILVRNQQASREALSMLDTVDWELVSEILGPRGSTLPDSVGLALRPDAPATVTGRSGFTAPEVRPGGGFTTRGAVIGGGVTAGVLIAAGVTAAIPVVGAAAVAAAAGGFSGMASGQLRRVFGGPQQEEAVTAAINAEFDALVDLVSRELDRSADAAHQAAQEQFDELDRLLAEADAGLADPDDRSPAPWAAHEEEADFNG
jgi:hypothetical protein